MYPPLCQGLQRHVDVLHYRRIACVQDRRTRTNCRETAAVAGTAAIVGQDLCSHSACQTKPIKRILQMSGGEPSRTLQLPALAKSLRQAVSHCPKCRCKNYSELYIESMDAISDCLRRSRNNRRWGSAEGEKGINREDEREKRHGRVTLTAYDRGPSPCYKPWTPAIGQ